MSRAPRKRALLVGINYPNTPNTLRGCINDVVEMNDVIAKHYGFVNNKDRRMLTDAAATTANILDRLEWLVDGAQPGDVLFFHYSGHGSQLIDVDYDTDDEPDGKDEIICPIDINWRDKVIKDDDFKRIFDKVPSGVNLTVVLDCCHSGGGTDAAVQYQPLGNTDTTFDPLSPNRARLMEMPVDIANRGYNMDLAPRPRSVQTSKNTESHGMLISGCQSNQTSADAFIRGKYVGAATFFLSAILQKHQYQITYKQLVDEMNNVLAQYGYDQRPELNGPLSKFDHAFLAPYV